MNIIKNKKFQIDFFIKNINNRNIEDLKNLININNNEGKSDYIMEIYKKNLLTPERLKFIIEKCNNFLYLSSSVIKEILKDNNVELLEIIFNNFKFYDNDFIKWLLFQYKNKTTISVTHLNKHIWNGKTKYSFFYNDNNLFNTFLKSKIHYLKEKFFFFPLYNKEVFPGNSYGERSLFNACYCENENMVKYLIEHGVDISRENDDGETLLFMECESGNENIVKFLVEHGADINKEKNNGETPLFMACKSGNENVVKYLIENGVNINKENHNFKTPLFIACKYGNENIVKILVEHGAALNKEKHNGKTPLFIACKYGNENIMKYLIEHGAFINKEKSNGETPLFMACKSKNVNIVNYLIEYGVDINKVNSDGETPLFMACLWEDEKIVKILVENGADINKINLYGETPLFMACRGRNINVIKYLVTHGADINIEINYGKTSLAQAYLYSTENIVKYLIKCILNKIDVHLKGKEIEKDIINYIYKKFSKDFSEAYIIIDESSQKYPLNISSMKKILELKQNKLN